MRKIITLGFVAGFLSVIVFHQSTAFLLNIHGYRVPELLSWIGRVGPAFVMAPAPPFGIPAVIQLGVWGGLFGIVLAALVRAAPVGDLFAGFVFGAVVVSLVAFATQGGVVPAFSGGGQQRWLQAVLLNGTWGWGAAFFLRPLALRG